MNTASIGAAILEAAGATVCTSKWRKYFRFLIVTAAAAAFGAEPAVVVDSHVKCVLGGWQKGAWVDTEAAVAAWPGAANYRLITPEGKTSKVSLGKPESAGGACEGTITSAVSPIPPEGKPYVVLGALWKPMPRASVDIIGGKARYRAAIQEFLTSKKIREAADIRQLLRVDLDGDGKDEVVAVVQNFSLDGTKDSGRYSAVLVRKLIGGRVQTLVAALEADPRDGGPSEHKVAMIADLNGDGAMELVVHGRYLQGIFTSVFAIEKDKLRKVLSCACGG